MRRCIADSLVRFSCLSTRFRAAPAVLAKDAVHTVADNNHHAGSQIPDIIWIQASCGVGAHKIRHVWRQEYERCAGGGQLVQVASAQVVSE